MKKLICIFCALSAMLSAQAKNYDNPDTLFVALRCVVPLWSITKLFT